MFLLPFLQLSSPPPYPIPARIVNRVIFHAIANSPRGSAILNDLVRFNPAVICTAALCPFKTAYTIGGARNRSFSCSNRSYLEYLVAICGATRASEQTNERALPPGTGLARRGTKKTDKSPSRERTRALPLCASSVNYRAVT